MKYLKHYNENNSIDSFCNKYRISNYKISNTGYVNTESEVYIIDSELEEIPIKFGISEDNFYITGTKISSLKNMPYMVMKSFSCSENNYLNSLQYSPTYVGLNYMANRLPIENLSGITKDIPLFLSLSDNKKLYDMRDLPNFDDYSFVGSPINFIIPHIEEFSNLSLFYDMKVTDKNTLYLNRLIEFKSIVGNKAIINTPSLNLYWNVNKKVV